MIGHWPPLGKSVANLANPNLVALELFCPLVRCPKMPILINPRHERLAQLLAQGKTATDAHEEAGYKRNDGNAAAMAKKPAIKARVMEINGSAAIKAEVTVMSLIAEAEAARILAMALDQPSAAVAAIREKGVLSGKRVEKSEHGEPGEFDAMADAELEDAIRREALQSGVDLPQESDTQH